MNADLAEVIRQRAVITSALAATLRQSKKIAERYTIAPANLPKGAVLLRITEALIAAHRAAKVDDDGFTLDLIEDALRHVGERLSKETGDGRDHCQSRLSPHR